MALNKISKTMLDTDVQAEFNKVGDLTTLSTTQKGSLVGAINENASKLADNVKQTEAWLSSSKYTDIQSALNDAVTKGIKKVLVPKKTYSLTSKLTIPSGIDIDFYGSTLQVPQGAAFNALEIIGCNNQKISNLKIIESSHNFTGVAYGVLIKNSDTITLENIYVEGFNMGFNIASDDSSTINKRITLKECRADWSRQYGFSTDNTIGVFFSNCYAYHNWFDGFKLRKNTKDIRVIGGESSYNGESYFTDSSSNGNGLDSYAGGASCTIIDLICDQNNGAGIYVKSGDLNYQTSADAYGYVNNLQITNVKCRKNLTMGLNINRVGADTFDYPFVANVVILGGLFEANNNDGIYIRGRNITLISPIVKGNLQNGINITSGYNIEVTSAQIIANGKSAAGSYYGISLFGKQIKILGGVINGADSDSLGVNDYTGLTVYHNRPINATSGSDEITIKDVTFLNWVTSTIPVRAVWTTGTLWVDYGKISSSTAYGSAGSTMIYNNVKYIKTTDITDISGWESINKKAATQADSTATDVATLKADFNALLSKLKTAKLMA